MPATAALQFAQTEVATDAEPIVIVGTGPVGMRTAQEILRRNPNSAIVLYGGEPWEPYHRTRLSSVLSGEQKVSSIYNPLEIPPTARVIQRHNQPILSIDRVARCVIAADGQIQRYSHLILATGSKPHIPHIDGIQRHGVFTFRDMNDTQALTARRVQSRHTVVLGGGLLGLEAARAMRRFNTHVTIVHHSSRLMNRQLDDIAAQRLLTIVHRLGIDTRLNDTITSVDGDDRVTTITLRSGEILPCDTLVIATGIRPNTELALNAGLHVGRGIRVDDHLRTNDPHIYSVGECAEHRGEIVGLVGPGLEQAAVAAHNVIGGQSVYSPSCSAARLKVVGELVFSMGEVGDEYAHVTDRTTITYGSRESGAYRKLLLDRGHLVGVVAIGEFPQIERVREAIKTRRRVWPWQARQFRRRGVLWTDAEQSVRDWPMTTVVCNCTGVTRGTLGEAMNAGCCTVPALIARTGASSVCGTCRPLLVQLTSDGPQTHVADAKASPLRVAAVIAAVLCALLLMLPAVPASSSVQTWLRPDVLWTNGIIKQVTGYFILALAVTSILVSARKRTKRFRLSTYAKWRYAHVLIGVVALAALVAHTGLSIGTNLNSWLILDFLALCAVGVAAALTTALRHTMRFATADKLTAFTTWLHIVLIWPLPVLLGFHILSVYYF